MIKCWNCGSENITSVGNMYKCNCCNAVWRAIEKLQPEPTDEKLLYLIRQEYAIIPERLETGWSIMLEWDDEVYGEMCRLFGKSGTTLDEAINSAYKWVKGQE